MAKEKKSWYKRWWAIVLYVIIGFWFLGFLVSEPEDVSESLIEEVTEEAEPTEEKIIEEQSTCTDECSQSTCDGFYYIDCLVEDDGCKDKQAKEKIKGKCSVECLKDSDCSSDETCSSNKCEEKSDFQKALEETQKAIEEQQEKTSKLNECTKACTGDYYDIPAVRDQYYLACWETYYYAGMKALEELIASCKE